jgi:hypothetical protein
VAVFSALGVVGIRVPFALIVGYLLHGVWDGIHEFNALAGGSLLEPSADRIRATSLRLLLRHL